MQPNPLTLYNSPQIVKERQMEFADNSDKEFLDELFGIDSDSLFEGPVWVYVLERRRAVEVWKSLMGEPDPVKARESSPNSLRALFGITSAQNAVMGSPNTDTAEEQISCLFQSSPPFPPHDPEDDDLIDGLHNQMGYNTLNHHEEHHNNNNLSASNDEDEDGDEDWQSRETTVLSPSSSQLSSSAHLTSPASSTTTNITRSPFSSLSKKTGGPIPALVPFKARPVPKTTLVPDISPRTTRAAILIPRIERHVRMEKLRQQSALRALEVQIGIRPPIDLREHIALPLRLLRRLPQSCLLLLPLLLLRVLSTVL